MNKIGITFLSACVLDALSVRGLKAKTVQEFERYGTRRIVKHCLDKGKFISECLSGKEPKLQSQYGEVLRRCSESVFYFSGDYRIYPQTASKLEPLHPPKHTGIRGLVGESQELQ